MNARHILLVVLDTLRRDHLSTYGYQRPTAPALDDLAGRAALFERAWAPAQWTLPAHASLFTGRYPSLHQLTQVYDRLGLQHATLAEVLQTAGWRTAAFCNNPLLAALDSGLQRGFTHFYSYAGVAPGRPALRSRASGRAWGRLMQPVQQRGARSGLLFRAALRPRLAPLWTRLIRFKGDGASSIEDLCDWYRQQRAGGADARHFIFLNLMGAHLPWRPRRAALGRVAPGHGPQGRRFVRRFNARAARWTLPPEPPLTADERQSLLDAYDAEILQQDEQLGRLFQALERMGALEDTQVIIVADHGETHGEHGYMGHGFGVPQELVQVPLLVYDPAGRFPAGQRVASPVSTRRVFHTALATAGLDAPLDAALPDADVARLDLATAAQGRDDAERVFSEAWPPETLLALLRQRNPGLLARRRLAEPRRAMVSGRHRLLLCGEDVEALYDTQEDPLEWRDLAPQQPQLAQRLRREMLAALPATQQATPGREPDASVAGTLRALGYIE
ncbi:MAG: sulfatase-like hydrolase/transferase [Anaerolineaceae bacterium]|nr:sulfatase-like hydrolase/transferase [Anaerolineaceae bacterium]